MIESKDEAAKRGVKSPDRAEALMLAFAERTPGIMDFYNPDKRPPEPETPVGNPLVPGLEATMESDADDLIDVSEQELKKLRERRS
ncbi:MAG TPA: hypothetical protein VKS22_16250 [Candidatus Binataceae bacterium]|nr:hypothetical protein [Candidatus Binataceae bacterium]